MFLCREKTFTTHNYSSRSDEGLALETGQLCNSLRWLIYFINSVDNTKIILLYSPTDAAQTVICKAAPTPIRMFRSGKTSCSRLLLLLIEILSKSTKKKFLVISCGTYYDLGSDRQKGRGSMLVYEKTAYTYNLKTGEK